MQSHTKCRKILYVKENTKIREQRKSLDTLSISTISSSISFLNKYFIFKLAINTHKHKLSQESVCVVIVILSLACLFIVIFFPRRCTYSVVDTNLSLTTSRNILMEKLHICRENGLNLFDGEERRGKMVRSCVS